MLIEGLLPMSNTKLMFCLCLMIFSILVSFSVLAAQVPDAMKKPIIDSVTDTSWLTGTTEEALKNLNRWYTPNLAKEIWPAIKIFRDQQTDWHPVYKVDKVKLCSSKKNEAVVKVEILEVSPDNSKRHLNGVYKLKKIKGQWKIDFFEIKPKEKQNIDTL
ncbi:MAG: hypothetical protein PWQ96_826 [Clostridia bacterium]|jgi:hypothetical protein|nr:hypothetical protein [Clostridia bacterium]